MPVAMNCAPCFDMVRRSVSPFLSINVTSFRSTTHLRLSSARWVFFQFLLSSLTHNPTKRPCRIHFSSAGVSVLVIFNTSISFVWLVCIVYGFVEFEFNGGVIPRTGARSLRSTPPTEFHPGGNVHFSQHSSHTTPERN